MYSLTLLFNPFTPELNAWGNLKDENLNGCHYFALTVVDIQCKEVNLRHMKTNLASSRITSMKQITFITPNHIQLLFWLLLTPYHLK
jgi:hypothetical protein